MNSKELMATSAEILIQYYENNIEPFLNALHANALWIGPLEGQILRSREAIIEAYRKEQNVMTFHLFDLNVSVAQHTAAQCDILMTFIVDSLYPDNSVIRCNQRIMLSWTYGTIRDETNKLVRVPEILTCFIANALPTHEKDNIYPNHFLYTSFFQSHFSAKGNSFSVKGNNHEVFYLSDRDIVYVENKRPGCIIHTTNNDFNSSESVSELQQKCPLFVRTHISYLVNPAYIQSVERFQVTLADDTVLPIPEKKYTGVKKQIARAMSNL